MEHLFGQKHLEDVYQLQSTKHLMVTGKFLLTRTQDSLNKLEWLFRESTVEHLRRHPCVAVEATRH